MGTSETHWMVILGGKQVTGGRGGGRERRGGRPSGDTRFRQHMTDRGSCKSQMFSLGENKPALLYPNKGVETQKQGKTSSELSGFVFLSVERRSQLLLLLLLLTLATSHSKVPRPGMHRQNTQPRSPRAGCVEGCWVLTVSCSAGTIA